MYGDNPLGDLYEKCQETPGCHFDNSSKMWIMCNIHKKAFNSSRGITNPIALRNLVTRYDNKTFVKESRFFEGHEGEMAKLVEIRKEDFKVE